MYYQFKQEQKLHCTIEEAWDFATSPKNLKEITPKFMLFEITSDNENDKIYPGMIISYKVAPIFNIKMNWVTEITQVCENKFFIDEQRLGPYKMWHHQHFFEDRKSFVVMKDIVTYIPPYGILGDLVNKFYLKKELQNIFEFRKLAMNRKFNS